MWIVKVRDAIAAALPSRREIIPLWDQLLRAMPEQPPVVGADDAKWLGVTFEILAALDLADETPVYDNVLLNAPRTHREAVLRGLAYEPSEGTEASWRRVSRPTVPLTSAMHAALAMTRPFKHLPTLPRQPPAIHRSSTRTATRPS